jgi:hypothetical protein
MREDYERSAHLVAGLVAPRMQEWSRESILESSSEAASYIYRSLLMLIYLYYWFSRNN